MKTITRKKYAIHFWYGFYCFLWRSVKIRFIFTPVHESPKENLEAVSKSEGHNLFFPHICCQFSLVKVIVSKPAYTSLENTKNERFFTTTHRKVAQEILQCPVWVHCSNSPLPLRAHREASFLTALTTDGLCNSLARVDHEWNSTPGEILSIAKMTRSPSSCNVSCFGVNLTKCFFKEMIRRPPGPWSPDRNVGRRRSAAAASPLENHHTPSNVNVVY